MITIFCNPGIPKKGSPERSGNSQTLLLNGIITGDISIPLRKQTTLKMYLPVTHRQSRQSVGYDNDGLIRHGPDILKHFSLGIRIQCGSGFIQYHYGTFRKNCPCDSESLHLSFRKPKPPFSQNCICPLGQLTYKITTG